ncbi:MAG: hypothetical protein WC375_09490, partial [Methanomassiliicoccales archaeon]
DYWSLGEVLSDMADFLFDSLVFIATGGFLFLWLHMVEEGLEMLCELASDAAETVKEAVDRLVYAFNELINWIIAFIQGVLDATIGPLISSVQQTFESYFDGIMTACLKAENDIEAHGNITTSSSNSLKDAILNDLFWILLTVLCTISIMNILLSTVTGPFAFATSLVVSLTISMIIVTIFKYPSDYKNGAETIADGGLDALKNLVFGEGGNVTKENMLSGVFDVLWGLLDVFCAAIIIQFPGLGDLIATGMGLILGGISIFLDIWGTALNSFMCDAVGTILGFFGFCESMINFRHVSIINSMGGKVIVGISLFVSGLGFGKNLLDIIRWSAE